MKSLGVIRKVDELGRVVLPVETRKRLGLKPKDPVEIFVERDRIVLRKYEPACIFCGSTGDAVEWKDKRVCRRCAEKIGAIGKDAD